MQVLIATGDGGSKTPGHLPQDEAFTISKLSSGGVGTTGFIAKFNWNKQQSLEC